jgi:hypothetical protein
MPGTGQGNHECPARGQAFKIAELIRNALMLAGGPGLSLIEDQPIREALLNSVRDERSFAISSRKGAIEKNV